MVKGASALQAGCHRFRTGTAYFIPDTAKRCAALNEWIKSTTPIIQAAIARELQDLVDFITEKSINIEKVLTSGTSSCIRKRKHLPV
jgi:hypothetical protein